jgi:acetyl-CoA acyltransferase
MTQGRDAVIVGAVRTPIGKGKANGGLHEVLPADLLAQSLRELVARTGVDPVQVDDVIAGAVTQVGDQAVNIARNALLGAGFPESVPGTTVDRQCGSSQQAISFAAQGVLAGAYDVVSAGGVESMSRVPMGTSVLPGSNTFGEDMARRYPEGLVPQGISAELIAARWGFSRTQLDEFSAASHEKAASATKDGLFDNELIPIAGLSTDEIIRPGTTVETLAGLQPAFYRPALHADRGHSRHREGVTPRRSYAGRHRPVRGQRGVRARGAGVGECREWGAKSAPIGSNERQRWGYRDRPSIGR